MLKGGVILTAGHCVEISVLCHLNNSIIHVHVYVCSHSDVTRFKNGKFIVPSINFVLFKARSSNADTCTCNSRIYRGG